MSNQKLSVTYVYSKDSEVAKYIEFLIDKVRNFDVIDFLPICLEEHKSPKSKIKKLQTELDKLTKGKTRTDAKIYSKALDLRQSIDRNKLALIYADLSPALILNRGTEEEITILGTKSSLAMLLDGFSKIGDLTKFFQSFDLSGFETMIKEAGKVAMKVIEDKTAGEGLETTQE